MEKTFSRPEGVPEGAVHIFEYGVHEWELGPRTADGKRNGDFIFWRADGTICNRCTQVNGVGQGQFYRYHENGDVSQEGHFVDGKMDGERIFYRSTKPTTELFVRGLPSTVWTCVMVYDQGKLLRQRLYTRSGERISMNGEPFPVPPQTVPADADFNEQENYWFTGEYRNDERRRKAIGLWSYWTKNGLLKKTIDYSDDGSYLESVYSADTAKLLSRCHFNSEDQKDGTDFEPVRSDDEQ